jgi:hypothetical protein
VEVFELVIVIQHIHHTPEWFGKYSHRS